MVTFHEGFSSRKSHDSLITWSCEITWKTKHIMSSLSQCFLPSILAGYSLVSWYMISVVDPYQGLIDKKMSVSEIIKNSNITKNDLKNYAVLSVFRDFKNMNKNKRIFIALEACWKHNIKKLTRKKKRSQFLKCKWNVKNTHL